MPPACVLEGLVPARGIDAGQRDVGAEPVDEQRAEREPDALLELLGLGERREIEIGRQLFCCRGHALELPFPREDRPHGRRRRGGPSALAFRRRASAAACSPRSCSSFSLRASAAPGSRPSRRPSPPPRPPIWRRPRPRKATLALSSPLPSSRTPSLARRSTPALTSAAASTVAPASSLPASIACLHAAEIDLVELARERVVLKPRFGRRRCSGIWPPSKPLMRTPERAFWPLPPRPPVLPLPEPMPRPMRLRASCARPAWSASLVELHDGLVPCPSCPARPRRRRVDEMRTLAIMPRTAAACPAASRARPILLRPSPISVARWSCGGGSGCRSARP